MSVYNFCLQPWMKYKKGSLTLTLFPYLFSSVMERIQNSVSNKTLPPARYLPIHAVEANGEYTRSYNTEPLLKT